MMEESSNRGLTEVQNARVRKGGSRELRHFKISLQPYTGCSGNTVVDVRSKGQTIIS